MIIPNDGHSLIMYNNKYIPQNWQDWQNIGVIKNKIGLKKDFNKVMTFYNN